MTDQLCAYISRRMVEFERETQIKPTAFYNLHLGIDCIDDIKCDTILLYGDHNMRIEITTHEWYYTNDEPEQLKLFTKNYGPIINFTAEEVKPIIDEIIADLEQLKFSKLNSSFKIGAESTMLDFLKTLQNVKVGSECCVCYEKTRFKTLCSHSLCIPCISQMKGNTEGFIECPMCRTHICTK